VTDAQHDEIAELLPDFAIGALSDGDLLRVEAHVETCARCQAELAWLLDFATVAAPADPPGAAVKHDLFQRAGHPLPELTELTEPPEPQPLQIIRPDAPALKGRILRLPSRLAWIALPAAVIALCLLGAWNLWLQRELDDQGDLIALVVEPGNAYPLTDSEVPTNASAIFYVDPERDQALLTAQNLPAPANDQRYQVWLFTEGGQRVSGGLFVPEPDGTVAVTVEPGDPLSTYVAVAISTEPEAGSDAPTSPLLLGGWIQ